MAPAASCPWLNSGGLLLTSLDDLHNNATYVHAMRLTRPYLLFVVQSELLWHEVLPSFRRRWAMSAWIPHCIDVTTGARTT